MREIVFWICGMAFLGWHYGNNPAGGRWEVGLIVLALMVVFTIGFARACRVWDDGDEPDRIQMRAELEYSIIVCLPVAGAIALLIGRVKQG